MHVLTQTPRVPVSAPQRPISYEEFGRRFLEYAVSEERIAAAFAALTGTAFDVGPIRVGPARLAKVAAHVRLGEPLVHRRVDEIIDFGLVLPLRVGLLVDLGIDRHRFEVDGAIHLRLAARTAEPLRVLIDIADPHPRDVRVNVAAGTKRAQLLRHLVGVDEEIRRFVATYLATELRKPHIAALLDVDVATRLDQAWAL